VETQNVVNMIIQETKLINTEGDEKHATGYFLTQENLEKLVRDFSVDCYDGFVSHDGAYIEQWMKTHSNT